MEEDLPNVDQPLFSCIVLPLVRFAISQCCKCCPYGGLTALPAVVSTLAFGMTYTTGSVALINKAVDYNDDVYVKSGAMIAMQAFVFLVMILAGPLYLAIMMICCVSFGRKQTFFKVTMSLSFFVAASHLLVLVRNQFRRDFLTVHLSFSPHSVLIATTFRSVSPKLE